MDGRFVLFVFLLFNCLFLFAFVCWHGHWAMGKDLNNILLLLKMPTITIILPVFANYLLFLPRTKSPKLTWCRTTEDLGMEETSARSNSQFFSLLHCIKNPSLYLSFQYFSISFSITIHVHCPGSHVRPWGRDIQLEVCSEQMRIVWTLGRDNTRRYEFTEISLGLEQHFENKL